MAKSHAVSDLRGELGAAGDEGPGLAGFPQMPRNSAVQISTA